jgi:hypothetical protein
MLALATIVPSLASAGVLVVGQSGAQIEQPKGEVVAQPLQELVVVGGRGKVVRVLDGQGREYVRMPASARVKFRVGGAPGKQRILVEDGRGRVLEELGFTLDPKTNVDDGGKFKELYDLLLATMRVYSNDGAGKYAWRGRTYRLFVPWILDHVHTAKGLQYFSPFTSEWVDLGREAQRKDGLIWSFIRRDEGPGYYDSSYGPYGYAWRDGGALFARQPVENHPEYLFVSCLYMAWKGSGDDGWMARSLDAAKRALDYGATDRSRWSTKFGLLKRGYTTDTWDFQVTDKYTVPFPLATAQQIDPDRTKFGIFYGDNLGYAQACEQLAAMMERAGRSAEASLFRSRGAEIRERLDRVSWNGRFFRHRVEEDPTVVRDLGVDEASQISLSNAYALNQGVRHDQAVAILRTYQELRQRLPQGSPGEWYAIYPPFERGFDGKDNQKWQYMNGGVHGHIAGELSRGAFEHGFEGYGADILSRVADLGKQHGRVYFAYTGATTPPPPAPVYTPVDLSAVANMDLWDQGAAGVPSWMGTKDPGNDLRNLPVGANTFGGIPFRVSDPARNGRRGAIGLSTKEGFRSEVEVPVNATAGAIHLLHTESGAGPENVAGTVTFRYADGSEASQYVIKGKHLAGWWYPVLKGPDAGVAWRGPNLKSTDVGVSRAVLTNPQPDKSIKSLVLRSSLTGNVYAVMGLTLADRAPYHAPGPISTGGPDNWSGGTCMAALIQGLGGVADTDVRFNQVRLAPRWTSAGVDKADVTVRYPASDGYVAYRYRHDRQAKQIEVQGTGSGKGADWHVLLPAGSGEKVTVTVDGRPVRAKVSMIEGSQYVDFQTSLDGVRYVVVQYGE